MTELSLFVALFLPVSGAKNADDHHLRREQLSEGGGGGLQRRPAVPLGDQDHHLRVGTGEEPRRAATLHPPRPPLCPVRDKPSDEDS